jgi:outer membrane protein assembly factor BamB
VNPCKATAAYAAEMTDAGTIAWQVSLPPGQAQYLPSPVVSKGVAVFADKSDLVGLRTADGHRLWDDRFRPNGSADGDLTGRWQWGGSAIALIDHSDTDWRLVAVNPADGKVRWQFKLGTAVSGESGVSPDGLLALVAPAKLYMLNLANGHVVWSRPFFKPDRDGNYQVGLLTTDGVLVAEHQQLVPTGPSVIVGFSEKTGHQLWARTGQPNQPVLQPDGRGVLMWGVNDVKSEQVPTPLTAFSAANGETLWHASVGFVYDVWSEPGQVVFGSRSGMYDVNPATGAKRWRLPGELSSPTNFGLLLTATDVLYYAGRGALTERRLSDGVVMWTQAAAPGGDYGTDNVAPDGPNAMIAVSNNFDEVPQAVVYTVNLRTGRLVTALKLPSDLPAASAVTGADAIYELNPEYCVYAGSAGQGASKS